MSVVKVEIPGRKPVRVDSRILETHRPKERPKDVTPEHWEASKCESSPTGAHYFRPRMRKLKGKKHHIRTGKLRCVFCNRSHSAIYAYSRAMPVEPENPNEEVEPNGS